MKHEQPPAPRTGGGRVTNRLVALSSAAVMTVYAAGYLRTQSAAARLHAAERDRIVIPVEAADRHGAVAPAPTPASPAAKAAISPTPQTRTAAHESKPASPALPGADGGRPKKTRPQQAEKPAAAVAPSNSPAAAIAQTTAAAPAASAATAIEAPQPTPTPTPAPAPAAPQWKDGTYSGWGTSRHGDIQATVVIESGKITSAFISQCWTRYSCSWVAHLQGQVVTRQSPEVDYVSGATQSTNAFYYAVVEALSKAR